MLVDSCATPFKGNYIKSWDLLGHLKCTDKIDYPLQAEILRYSQFRAPIS